MMHSSWLMPCGVLGIPFLENWKSIFAFVFLWFYSLWFYGFIVLWFCDFMVLWFHGAMAFNSLPKLHLMFLIAIDPLSKIFKVVFNGSSSFVRCLFFWNLTFGGYRISRFINILFLKCASDLLDLFRCPGVSKDKISWLSGLVTGSKIPKS